MLKVLKEREQVNGAERIESYMPEDVYEMYKKERNERWKSFKESIEEFNFEKLPLIPSFDLGIRCCQTDFPNILFDENICRPLESGEEKGETLTLKDGGTIPCAMTQVLQYFNYIPQNGCINVAQVLAHNGYRIHGIGVLWSAVDIVFPLKYNIDSSIPCSVKELLVALKDKNPVMALVPVGWLKGDDSLPTNAAIIIWGIRNGNFIVSDTFKKETYEIPVKELLKLKPEPEPELEFEHIKMAWVLSKK